MIKNQSIFKNNEYKLNTWIVKNFPEGYQDMQYLEPFDGNLNLILQKDKSKIEVINNVKSNHINVYRAIRDEASEFVKRINLHKSCEDTFNKCLLKNKFDDYFDEAVNEYVLTKLSRGENKKTFFSQENWKENNKKLISLSKRINDVYILNEKPEDLLNKFCTTNSLLFIKDINSEYIKIINQLNSKLIICISKENKVRKNFKDWNAAKNSSFNYILFKNY